MEVTSGMSVESIAKEAKDLGVVRSSFFLYTILTYAYDPTRIYAGTYHFENPSDVFEVAKKLAQSDVDMTLTALTIPEGVTRKDIARIASGKLPGFNTDSYLELTKNNEGYLFPDTYFVPKDLTAAALVDLQAETYAKKLAPLKAAIASSSFSEYEVLTLASILEREANSEESMRIVSGILQNRLKKGMPLQTDASIEYVLDKKLSELTPEDLELDTPYNTYKYKGLTPTPIGNPGLAAIRAVLEPEKTPYLYYLTGNDGVFHYAKTFEEHKKNIATYLK
jgi:UPF0755 protein